MKSILLSLIFIVSISFGQFQVDSIAIDTVVDTVYNVISTGVQLDSLSISLNFLPVGRDSVIASYSISKDSAKTWSILRNDTSFIKCNQMHRTNFKLLSGVYPNTAFQVSVWNYDSIFEFVNPIPQDSLKVGHPITVQWKKFYDTVTAVPTIYLSLDSGATYSELSSDTPLVWAPTPNQISSQCLLKAQIPVRGPLSMVKITSGVFNIVDTTEDAPVITLLGPNPDTIGFNTTFTDPGATAIDLPHGRITSKVQASGTVNTSIVGTYMVSYNVSDVFGSPAVTKTRTVVVSTSLLPVYGVPLSTPLPSVNKTYKNVTVNPSGSGPNLSSLTSFGLNWDLTNRGLYGFALNYTSSPFYQSFTSMSQTFGQVNPQFTINGTGIAGLDGTYYISANATQCVWVRTDGSFAVVFTP